MIPSGTLIPVASYCFALCVLSKDTTVENCIIRFAICLTSLAYFSSYARKGIQLKLPAQFQKIATYTILSQFMMTFALTLWSSIKESLWSTEVQLPLQFTSMVHFLFYGILQITCLSAIEEELLFRCIANKLLGKITGNRLLTTITSSLIFSLMHCNVTNNLVYFIMGCFFSYLYQKTEQLIYPIIAHAVHNLFVVSLFYFRLDKVFIFTINSLSLSIRGIIVIGCLLAAFFSVHQILLATQKQH